MSDLQSSEAREAVISVDMRTIDDRPAGQLRAAIEFAETNKFSIAD